MEIREDEVAIVAVATMRHVIKGHRYLIEAAARMAKKVSNVKFLLAGSGPLQSHLEAYASELGVRSVIHFLGSRRDIAAVLNAAADLSRRLGFREAATP